MFDICTSCTVVVTVLYCFIPPQLGINDFPVHPVMSIKSRRIKFDSAPLMRPSEGSINIEKSMSLQGTHFDKNIITLRHSCQKLQNVEHGHAGYYPKPLYRDMSCQRL